MLTTVIGAVAALIGILLGGGVRAAEAHWTRVKEREALLSALVAEVEALSRLASHRRFLDGILQLEHVARDMVEAGKGDEPAPFMTIYLSRNYFQVFDASAGKLGLLLPYHADRIVRFYTYAKAVLENYDAGSPFQNGASAAVVADLMQNDKELLHTVLLLGDHIAGFRTISKPKGVSELGAFEPFGDRTAATTAVESAAPTN